VVRTSIVVMGQDAALFARAGVGPLEHWQAVEAPARRRRWYDSGEDVLAVLLASESDVDDLIPTLVAFQIEWNKIHGRTLAVGWPLDEPYTPEAPAAALGGAPADWTRLEQAAGQGFEELMRFREGRTEGSWENCLYFVARAYFDAGGPELKRRRGEAERAAGVEHLSSRTALRVAAQVIPLARLDPARLDPRLGAVDGERLARSEAVLVNTDYPLGVAAYNLLREVAIDSADLRGVYVLGKAATLNAD